MVIVVFFIIQRLKLQKIVYKSPFLKKTLDNVFCLHSGLVIKKRDLAEPLILKLKKNRIYKHFNYVANRRTFAKQVNKKTFEFKAKHCRLAPETR